MGIIAAFLKKAMLADPEIRQIWETIQKLRDQGDHSEADRMQQDLEDTLRKFFANE